MCIRDRVITFTDLDGRLLALKPDVTLSIAKTAQPAPGETLCYYYHENVYRPSAESHTFKEIDVYKRQAMCRAAATQWNTPSACAASATALSLIHI